MECGPLRCSLARSSVAPTFSFSDRLLLRLLLLCSDSKNRSPLSRRERELSESEQRSNPVVPQVNAQLESDLQKHASGMSREREQLRLERNAWLERDKAREAQHAREISELRTKLATAQKELLKGEK